MNLQSQYRLGMHRRMSPIVNHRGFCFRQTSAVQVPAPFCLQKIAVVQVKQRRAGGGSKPKSHFLTSCRILLESIQHIARAILAKPTNSVPYAPLVRKNRLEAPSRYTLFGRDVPEDPEMYSNQERVCPPTHHPRAIFSPILE